jgi:CBS domain containing-hemolysin-like protein
MSDLTLGLLFALCVFLEGFFSGSEIALVSSDRMLMREKADAGSVGAQLALKLLAKPAWALGTCLVGTNLSAISASTLVATLVTGRLGLPAAAAAAFVVPLTLTFGEMVPKALYQHHANRLAPIVALPLYPLSVLLRPALWVLDRLSQLAGGDGHAERGLSRRELQLLLDGAKSADLSPEDRRLLSRVLSFNEGTVEDAMVPLIEVTALPSTASLTEAARRMAESGHSRMPVYRDRVDDIIGIVLHQDIIAAPNWTEPVSSLLRPAMFVPESKRIDQLLVEMRRQKQRMAVAVDEYGGAVGLITIEDVLEELVGEIEDESDRPDALVRRTGEREWLAAGRAEREHLEAAAGLTLPDGDFETLAGFLLSVLGRVPSAGEQMTVGRCTLTVMKASERAIIEVRVRRER